MYETEMFLGLLTGAALLLLIIVFLYSAVDHFRKVNNSRTSWGNVANVIPCTKCTDAQKNKSANTGVSESRKNMHIMY